MTPKTKKAIEQVFDELFAMPSNEFHKKLATYANDELTLSLSERGEFLAQKAALIDINFASPSKETLLFKSADVKFENFERNNSQPSNLPPLAA